MRNWRDVVKRVERVLLSLVEAQPQLLLPIGTPPDDKAWDSVSVPPPDTAVRAVRTLLRFLQVVLYGCRTRHLFRGTRVSSGGTRRARAVPSAAPLLLVSLGLASVPRGPRGFVASSPFPTCADPQHYARARASARAPR